MKHLLFYLWLFMTISVLGACASARSAATGVCRNYDEFNKRYVRCGNYNGGAW